MRTSLLATVAFAAVAFGATRFVSAHCEVPCGIYDDQRRFVDMLEDQATIAKAINSVVELAGKSDAQSVNQAVRWVTTKEAHATNVQHIIAQYFMTQRIKPGTDATTAREYVNQLTAAHAVMQAAMKCKQTADPATAEKLRETILDFYRAYEGKEPEFEEDH